MDTDRKIKKEIRRLNGIFKDITLDKKELCIELIKNAAFLSVQMKELTDRMNEEGVISEYQNGENQFGTKESPLVTVYCKFHKQYSGTFAQLNDLLPKNKQVDATDGFKDLMNL